MSDMCAKTIRISCPGQESFDLTYPTCDAAKTAQFRLARSAKSCTVDYAGGGGLSGTRRRRKAKKANKSKARRRRR